MGDVPVPSDQARDPFERRMPGQGLNRDPERSPMRWDASANAGFTTGEPWLPVGDDVEGCNVEVQRKDARSLLTLYRSLLGFRGNASALRAGSYEPFEGSAEILAYAAALMAEGFSSPSTSPTRGRRSRFQAQVRSWSPRILAGQRNASRGAYGSSRMRGSFLKSADANPGLGAERDHAPGVPPCRWAWLSRLSADRWR
jgi:hypothetical protein